MDKAKLPAEKPDAVIDRESVPLYGVPSALPTGEVDLVQRIGSRLQQAPDTESVLRIALEELGTLLGAQAAVVRLGTREQLLDVGRDSGDES